MRIKTEVLNLLGIHSYSPDVREGGGTVNGTWTQLIPAFSQFSIQTFTLTHC